MAQEILHVTGLTKTFGTKVILDQVDLSINAGDRIGVIGRNGAGKSTLFRILTGEVEEDAGSVALLGGARLGILEQDAVYSDEEVVVLFLERYTGAPSWESYRLAQEFGLSRQQMDGVIADLSGGYRMRMMIVALLLQKPDVLLLDEPTNYMDLSTILALESFLQGFRGTLMVISHDREFLRRVTDQTLEVDQGKAIQSAFPIDEYLVWKDQEVLRKVRENEKIVKKQEQLQQFVDRFGSKATKASQAQSKLKQIARLDKGKHTVYRPDTTVRIAIPDVMSKSGPAITFEDFSAGYRQDRMIIESVDEMIERGAKVAVVGNNGEGKSTFLKSILGKTPYTHGSIKVHPQLRVGWYSQFSAETLPLDRTAWEYARQVALSDTSDQHVRDMLGSFLFSSDDVDKSIAVLSGGERSRLALLGLFLQAFDIYLLDEPSNHLDVETSEILALSLREFTGTVLVVSHDRTFVHLVDPEVYEVKDGSVRLFPGTYQQYVDSLFDGQQVEGFVGGVEDSSSSESSRKQMQRELFEAKKQQKKLEEAIKNYELEVAMGIFEAQSKLWETEDTWVKVSEHIECLEQALSEEDSSG